MVKLTLTITDRKHSSPTFGFRIFEVFVRVQNMEMFDFFEQAQTQVKWISDQFVRFPENNQKFSNFSEITKNSQIFFRLTGAINFFRLK